MWTTSASAKAIVRRERLIKRKEMNTRCRVTATVKTLGIVVGLLAVCACQYDPYTVLYATSKPDPQEVSVTGSRPMRRFTISLEVPTRRRDL